MTGTLQIIYQQELNGTAPGQLVALLLQPRPGDVLQIVNYNALRQGGRLPRGAKSGSVLLVTGSRWGGCTAHAVHACGAVQLNERRAPRVVGWRSGASCRCSSA